MSALESDGRRERDRKCTQTHPKGHQSNLCFTASQSSPVLLFETVRRSHLFEVEVAKLCSPHRCNLLRFMNKQVSGWSKRLQFFFFVHSSEIMLKLCMCVCFLLKDRTVMDQITSC